MRFSGVTLAHVPPVKNELVSPVSFYKANRSLQNLCANISSGSGASD